jgi:hypothetical protein
MLDSEKPDNVSEAQGPNRRRAPTIAGEQFMKLKLIAAISALVAIAAFAYAQQGQSNVPKPTKADVQNVVQIVTADKAKTQAYCDLTKLYDQVEAAAEQKNDTNIEALTKQANVLVDKLGPEYSKMAEGLEKST